MPDASADDAATSGDPMPTQHLCYVGCAHALRPHRTHEHCGTPAYPDTTPRSGAPHPTLPVWRAVAAVIALSLAITGAWCGESKAALAQQSSGAYVLAATWQSVTGNLAPDAWRKISGIDTLPDGTVFIADSAARRVTVIEPDDTVRLFRPPGSRPRLGSPAHLAVDPEAGRLYLADAGADAIEVFSLDGSHIATWSDIPGAFGIARDPDGTLVVSLAETGYLRRYSESGALVHDWQAAHDDGEGDLLRGVHVAASGRVFVVDGRTSEVVSFQPDGTRHATLRPTTARVDVHDLAVEPLGSGATQHQYWLAASFGVLYHESRTDTWTTNPVGRLSAIAVGESAGILAATAGQQGAGSTVLRIPYGTGEATPSRRWGSTLLSPGTFLAPERVSIGADGLAHILDRGARIQHYSLDGQPVGQTEHPNPVHVAAGANETVYVTDGSILAAHERGGDAKWETTIARATEDVNAVGLVYSVAGDYLAVLDTLWHRVRRFSSDGVRGPETALPEGPDSNTVWSDLAADALGRLYALDRANSLLHVVASDGTLDTLSLPSPARRMAASPDGAIFTLGRDGWVRQYDSGGVLAAAFDATRFDFALASSPSDLDIDDQGNVYVTDRAANVVSRHAWDGSAVPVEPPPETGGQCRYFPDKTARPQEIRLGDTVEVRLTVRGGCGPGVSPEPLDLVLILDRSGSMQGERLRILKEAALNFVADVDFDASRVAVISFNETARRDVGLSADARRVRDAIRGLQATGETAIHNALELAREEAVRRGRPDCRDVFILFSDGDSNFDRAVAQARSAKRDGVEIFTIGIQAWQALMREIATDEDHYYSADSARYLYGIFESISDRVTTATLFRTIEVSDEVPSNMQFVLGSAQPPAAFDGHTLRWTLSDVAFSGFALQYELEPAAAGEWPTNDAAWAQFVDGFGSPGRLGFPVPRVKVLGATVPTATDAPSATASPTPTPSPSITPPPTREPRPIYLPLALREECVPGERHADVVLVMDTSSSMTGAKLAAAKEAALLFIGLLELPEDQIGIVAFHAEASLVSELTGSPQRLQEAVSSLEPEPGTRIDLGLEAGYDELTSTRREPQNSAVLVLLTDGVQGDPAPAIAVADQAREAGVRIFAIGLGDDVDAAFLEQIAGGPGGLHLAPDPSDLASIYKQVAGAVPCPPEDFWGKR